MVCLYNINLNLCFIVEFFQHNDSKAEFSDFLSGHILKKVGKKLYTQKIGAIN